MDEYTSHILSVDKIRSKVRGGADNESSWDTFV